MFEHSITRPAEWLHTRRCLGAAMVAAVENMRDAATSDHAFRVQAQSGDVLAWADEYLTSGTATCLCHMWDVLPAADAPDDANRWTWVCSCGEYGTGLADVWAATAAARHHDETAVA